MNIKTVTVIGANGTMGQNIAGIFASFGAAKVYMVARDLSKAEAAKSKAALSVKAASISARLVAADYSMLDSCVAESDLVFESVFEDMTLKKEIASIVSKSLNKNAVTCTGTSGLSITTLAEQYPESMRNRFFGVHMFNPPYNLNLCELISTPYSNTTLLEELEQYLKNTLLRTVVRVKDSPAFLGNRIGFQFINEVLQAAQAYKHSGGIDYMDAILGAFSGRTMAPLVTCDFVGLDIHKAIVDNLYQHTADYAHETFALPDFAQQLILENKLGRKTKGGLYKTITHDNGVKQRMVYDVLSGDYREVMQYRFPFAEKMIAAFRIGNYREAFEILIQNQSIEAELCLQFLLKYVIYSLSAATTVGYDVHSADDVMATGFNWCPPLAIVDALRSVTSFKELIRERLDPNIQKSIDLDSLLASVVSSKYDYRSFFKAKR